MVRVLYFAIVRERLGRDFDDLAIGAGTTAGALWDEIVRIYPQLGSLRGVVKLAVNEEMVGLDRLLEDGDVLALIPPVAGGAGSGPGAETNAGAGGERGLFRVSEAPLSLDEVVSAVSDEAQGGIATFTGVVRRQSRGKRVVRLEYEAYRPMAERVMRELGASLIREQPGVRVAMVHRVGVLAVGEAAVVIAASAPHRAAAFAACEAAIDRLKETVPIWKKEITDDGAEWIGLGP